MCVSFFLQPEREFLNLLPQALLDAGALCPTAEGSSLLAPAPSPAAAAAADSSGSGVEGVDPRRDEFVALGWLLGYACVHHDSQQVSIPGLALSPATLRLLLGQRVGTGTEAGWRAALEDLEAQDPELRKQLGEMLETEGVGDWALTFEARTH